MYSKPWPILPLNWRIKWLELDLLGLSGFETYYKLYISLVYQINISDKADDDPYKLYNIQEGEFCPRIYSYGNA